LTPLLVAQPVVEALRRATAPVLLVGGTADPAWVGPLARRLSPYVLEVPGADHGMYVPGPLARSAEVLGRVATAVEEFLDGTVWR
jgi:pimeloyl-ACP methyl ester carboxylesterase